VVLVVDLSGSMSQNIHQLRSASSDLVDALRGTDNRVALVAFGNQARVEAPLTDVGDDSGRAQVKKRIQKLSAGGLILAGPLGGGTNWEAGLREAATLRPDLVVLISDGEPNASDTQPTGGPGAAPAYAANPALGAAVNVADGMRANGVRVVAVGVGFTASSVANLAAVSGPVLGDDYFTTDADALLRQLYEVASRACGIPVAALPQPLGGSFPLKRVVIAALAGLLLVVGAGVALSRRRAGPRDPTAPRRPAQEPILPVTLDVSALKGAGEPANPTGGPSDCGGDPDGTRPGAADEADEPAEPVTFGLATTATAGGDSRPARSGEPDEPDWSGVTAGGSRPADGARRSGDGFGTPWAGATVPPSEIDGSSELDRWPGSAPLGPRASTDPSPATGTAPADAEAASGEPDRPAPRRPPQGRRISTSFLFDDDPPAE
jgi:hypothetical protein